MASTTLEIGEDLGALLAALGQPVERTAREMIVLELFRRGTISSGKAAELLRMPRAELIHRASDLGIPFMRFNDQEWEAEIEESRRS
jgi:predicted HTH domain antitoxin